MELLHNRKERRGVALLLVWGYLVQSHAGGRRAAAGGRCPEKAAECEKAASQ